MSGLFQEESVEKQEKLKRSTIQYEADLRHQNEMKRLEAELRGKAQVERENKDLRMEQMRAKAQENRETVIEAIKWVLREFLSEAFARVP